MLTSVRYNSLILLAVLALGICTGCSSNEPDDPRSTVIAFFGAMEKNDQASLARLLDLPSLMANTQEDYSVSTDEPRIFHNPQDILNDLTNDGLTKQRWFSYQRIINNASITGDAGTVEVTFVDKERSKGYRTNFGVHKLNGKWRIYSFKTFEEPSQGQQ